MKISTIYPVSIKNHGAGYACQSILEGMLHSGADADLFCITCERSEKRSFHRLIMQPWAKSLGYRLFSEETLIKLTEWRYLQSICSGDVAYIWPGTYPALFRSIKSKGNIVVAENINTHQATSKAILDVEYLRLGLPINHGITQRNVDEENAKLDFVDYVFSPSPEVTCSLRSAGMQEHQIIQTSYGLGEKDLFETGEIPANRLSPDVPAAIFVGTIGVRKGVHLLLKYWSEAKVNGVLKLVGDIEANARHLIEPYLSQPNVQHIPFTNDLKSLYRAADVFIFPSLEEGSPLVTYLALGAGLPALVSPMGSGGVVQHEQDGLVIDPHDGKSWVDAIRDIFSDVALRQRFSMNARNKAPDYLWQNVGYKRYSDLIERINQSKHLT